MSGFMLHGLGDCTPALHCGCLAELEERGMRHWTALADRLTREAALRAVVREGEDDE